MTPTTALATYDFQVAKRIRTVQQKIGDCRLLPKTVIFNAQFTAKFEEQLSRNRVALNRLLVSCQQYLSTGAKVQFIIDGRMKQRSILYVRYRSMWIVPCSITTPCL